MLRTAAYTKTENLIWKLIEKTINLRLPGQGIQYARCLPPHFVPWKACEKSYFQVKVPFDNFYSKFAISQFKKTIPPPPPKKNLNLGLQSFQKKLPFYAHLTKLPVFPTFEKFKVSV